MKGFIIDEGLYMPVSSVMAPIVNFIRRDQPVPLPHPNFLKRGAKVVPKPSTPACSMPNAQVQASRFIHGDLVVFMEQPIDPIPVEPDSHPQKISNP